MTKTEMVGLVDRQLECYNRLDLDGFAACYHDQIEILFLITGTRSDVGIELFKKNYKTLFESAPQIHAEVKTRIVLDEELVTGIAKFPDGLHTTAIYGFRDGLIDRVWFAR